MTEKETNNDGLDIVHNPIVENSDSNSSGLAKVIYASTELKGVFFGPNPFSGGYEEI